MIVTVLAVREVEMTIDQVADMIPMRHGLVTAAGTMDVAARMAAA